MTRLPTKLLMQCVEELKYREQSSGSWRGGLPLCFQEAGDLLKLRTTANWVLIVENIVKSQCLLIVSQLDEGTLRHMNIQTE